jgi:3-hydroxyisobutyrate dehydrogenase-like beta-hydroxyacid dehydrogenase
MRGKEPTMQAENVTAGVIGLGLIRSAFASNLLSRGYKVHVFNRTKEKADPLIAKVAVAQYSKAAENGDDDKDFSVIALELERANKLAR